MADSLPVIRVAVALVADQGRHLIGRRAPHQPQGGSWEFPGGKCRPGESPAACAVRECLEETGLVIEVIRLRADLVHDYEDRRVRLFFFDCRPAGSAPPCSDRLTTFQWVPTRHLRQYPFPPANEPVLASLIDEWMVRGAGEA